MHLVGFHYTKSRYECTALNAIALTPHMDSVNVRLHEFAVLKLYNVTEDTEVVGKQRQVESQTESQIYLITLKSNG